MLVSGLTHGYTLCKKKKKVALIESVYKKKRKIKDTCWWVDGVIPGGGSVLHTYMHEWYLTKALQIYAEWKACTTFKFTGSSNLQVTMEILYKLEWEYNLGWSVSGG